MNFFQYFFYFDLLISLRKLFTNYIVLFFFSNSYFYLDSATGMRTLIVCAWIIRGELIWGKNWRFFFSILSPSNIRDCMMDLVRSENLLLILMYYCCLMKSLSNSLKFIFLVILGFDIRVAIFLFYYSIYL